MRVDLPITKLDGVAWFVQISDLHLSKYDHLPERQKLYGDKLGDLRCPSLSTRLAGSPLYGSPRLTSSGLITQQGLKARLPSCAKHASLCAPQKPLLCGDLTRTGVQTADKREYGCRTFARTVLSGLQPGALLITGDLIDAKSRLGRGQQWEEEWQVGL